MNEGNLPDEWDRAYALGARDAREEFMRIDAPMIRRETIQACMAALRALEGGE